MSGVNIKMAQNFLSLISYLVCLRSLLCFWAVRELDISLNDFARWHDRQEDRSPGFEAVSRVYQRR